MAQDGDSANTLRSILARVIDPKLSPPQLNDELELQRDFNIDSAMLVDIVLDLEEHHFIHVADQDMDGLRTVGRPLPVDSQHRFVAVVANLEMLSWLDITRRRSP